MASWCRAQEFLVGGKRGSRGSKGAAAAGCLPSPLSVSLAVFPFRKLQTRGGGRAKKQQTKKNQQKTHHQTAPNPGCNAAHHSGSFCKLKVARFVQVLSRVNADKHVEVFLVEAERKQKKLLFFLPDLSALFFCVRNAMGAQVDVCF